MTKMTIGELKDKVSKKFGLPDSKRIERIILLPNTEIVDDDDVGCLADGDVLEFNVNTNSNMP